MKKPSTAPRKAKASTGTEYRFSIDAYTPETMPMARLAEYMSRLAEILGEPSAVHFDRLVAGSTVLVHRIEREALPKVRERAAAVQRGDAPREAIRAYRAINRLLREDNGVGVLRENVRGAKVLLFPGREETEETISSVRQTGTIDGFVMKVGGTDETVPVLLKSEDQLISHCWTTKPIAKQLAHKLFEPVRLFGTGRWGRDADGMWTLHEFEIKTFESMQDVPLSAAIAELRAIDGDWGSEAYQELAVIRNGPARRRHGGH